MLKKRLECGCCGQDETQGELRRVRDGWVEVCKIPEIMCIYCLQEWFLAEKDLEKVRAKTLAKETHKHKSEAENQSSEV